MIDLQIANPIPMPSDFVVKNPSKMRSVFAGSMPAPVSSTLTRTLLKFVNLASDPQVPRTILDRSHGVDCIHDQVQENLLQLNPVRQNRRKNRIQLQID